MSNKLKKFEDYKSLSGWREERKKEELEKIYSTELKELEKEKDQFFKKSNDFLKKVSEEQDEQSVEVLRNNYFWLFI